MDMGSTFGSTKTQFCHLLVSVKGLHTTAFLNLSEKGDVSFVCTLTTLFSPGNDSRLCNRSSVRHWVFFEILVEKIWFSKPFFFHTSKGSSLYQIMSLESLFRFVFSGLFKTVSVVLLCHPFFIRAVIYHGLLDLQEYAFLL